MPSRTPSGKGTHYLWIYSFYSWRCICTTIMYQAHHSTMRIHMWTRDSVPLLSGFHVPQGHDRVCCSVLPSHSIIPVLGGTLFVVLSASSYRAQLANAPFRRWGMKYNLTLFEGPDGGKQGSRRSMGVHVQPLLVIVLNIPWGAICSPLFRGPRFRWNYFEIQFLGEL